MNGPNGVTDAIMNSIAKINRMITNGINHHNFLFHRNLNRSLIVPNIELILPKIPILIPLISITYLS